VCVRVSGVFSLSVCPVCVRPVDCSTRRRMSLRFIASVKDDAGWRSVVRNAPKTTLCVCDVYTAWCGPCTALENKLQQLYVELTGSDVKVRYYATARRVHRPLTSFSCAAAPSMCRRWRTRSLTCPRTATARCPSSSCIG